MSGMNHPDKRLAKSIDCPGRASGFTDAVYSGEGDAGALWAEMNRAEHEYDSLTPMYNLYIGEMHGHTNLSDGQPDIDSYFLNLRDNAKVDFAAISDHDHGGVGRPELWAGSPSKWDLIKEKVREYNDPGKFTTILAYERDSYPFYNNMILYFDNYDAEMYRGARDGEITESELKALFARKDVIVCPHDTYSLSSGCDFSTLPLNLITPFIEIYSRGDAAEYMGNPANEAGTQCAGGWFQDALKRGAHIGVIGGSDDHRCQNGIITDAAYPFKFPGLTGVWAKDNTLPSIFEALRAKRCFAFMGGRITVDFRINGHFMGEAFTVSPEEDLTVEYKVSSECPVKRVCIVKNCRDYVVSKSDSLLFFDYRRELPEDCYYLRAEFEDGRFAWSSPIWVKTV